MKIDLSTKKFKYHTKKAEEELVTANFKITALHRRIEEKDVRLCFVDFSSLKLTFNKSRFEEKNILPSYQL